MTRRWIIRSFFISLLLLFTGVWVMNYRYCWIIGYNGENSYEFRCDKGQYRLGWWHHSEKTRGWIIWADIEWQPIIFAGFSKLFEYDYEIIYIPLWFPTFISAAGLWFAWRKTRPKIKARAFPVELEKPKAAQNIKAQ